jgi:hypothetical protein
LIEDPEHHREDKERGKLLSSGQVQKVNRKCQVENDGSRGQIDAESRNTGLELELDKAKTCFAHFGKIVGDGVNDKQYHHSQKEKR